MVDGTVQYGPAVPSAVDVSRMLLAALPRVRSSLRSRGTVDADEVADRALDRTVRAYLDGRVTHDRAVRALWRAARSERSTAARAAAREAAMLACVSAEDEAGLAGAWASSLASPEQTAQALQVLRHVGLEKALAHIDAETGERPAQRALVRTLAVVDALMSDDRTLRDDGQRPVRARQWAPADRGTRSRRHRCGPHCACPRGRLAAV